MSKPEKEFYGNQDAKKAHPLPQEWEKSKNKVFARQQRKIVIDGVEQLVDHAIPIQAYDAKAFDAMRDSLVDQGIVLTPLHDDRAKVDVNKSTGKADQAGQGSDLVDMKINETDKEAEGKTVKAK